MQATITTKWRLYSSLACYNKVLGAVLSDFMHLWWRSWHWSWFFSEFDFHLLIITLLCTTLIHCQLLYVLALTCQHIICTYTHTHTHTHTHIHIFHGSIRVSQTVGCGTHHNYTNVHKFYSVKCYKHFTKQYYRSSLLFIHKDCQTTW